MIAVYKDKKINEMQRDKEKQRLKIGVGGKLNEKT